MVTLEEIVGVVVVLYFLVLILGCVCVYLLSRYEAMRERERRKKFKNEVVDEVCSYFEQTRSDGK